MSNKSRDYRSARRQKAAQNDLRFSGSFRRRDMIRDGFRQDQDIFRQDRNNLQQDRKRAFGY